MCVCVFVGVCVRVCVRVCVITEIPTHVSNLESLNKNEFLPHGANYVRVFWLTMCDIMRLHQLFTQNNNRWH